MPRTTTLTPPASYDKASLIVLLRPPPVTDTRKVPLVPPLARHTTLLSDAQSDASHADPPTRPAALDAYTPNPDPLTVTLAHPVLPTLPRTTTLTPPASYDKASLVVPAIKPAVIITRRVAEMPLPARHTTLLSDAQSDASHADPPTRPAALDAYVPNPDPLTVTLTLPVLKTFIRITLETRCASYDAASLIDPVLMPAVTDTWRVPPVPRAARHITELSDTQSDASHADAPTRPATLDPYNPKPDPATVTLTLPVPPAFPLTILLSNDASYERTPLNVPARTPIVTPTRRLAVSPMPPLHLMLLSDIQSVASHAEGPMRVTPVTDISPKLDPCTVTLIDPVLATLPRTVVLNDG